MWRPPTALRGISSIVTGSVAGQGLAILAYPFLTPMYTPAQFGLLVFASAAEFSVSYRQLVWRCDTDPADKREATAVAWVGLAAVMVTSMLVAVAGVAAADPLANLLDVPQLADYWWLVALSVFVWGVYLILSEWMVRERSYGALARRSLLQGIGKVAVQVGLGLAGVKPAGPLLGTGAGRRAALGGPTSRGGLLRQPRPAVSALRAAGRRFRRFALRRRHRTRHQGGSGAAAAAGRCAVRGRKRGPARAHSTGDQWAAGHCGTGGQPGSSPAKPGWPSDGRRACSVRRCGAMCCGCSRWVPCLLSF